MVGVHRATAEEAIRKRRWTYGAVFRRVRQGRTVAELRTDGIAGCLRTPRGGSARQILFKGGYGRYQFRLFSPRECARLMGADDFRIEAPNESGSVWFRRRCVRSRNRMDRHTLSDAALH